MKNISFDLGDVSKLEKALRDANIRELAIPEKFAIPSWPKIAAPAKIDLKRRSYTDIAVSRGSGLLRLENREGKMEFTVFPNGAFRFDIQEEGKRMMVRSDDISPADRLRSVFLFRQFREEICGTLVAEIAKGAAAHNEAVDEIDEALSTFLPYMVADALEDEREGMFS